MLDYILDGWMELTVISFAWHFKFTMTMQIFKECSFIKLLDSSLTDHWCIIKNWYMLRVCIPELWMQGCR